MEQSNSRAGSEAPSSSSDFYAPNPPPKLPLDERMRLFLQSFEEISQRNAAAKGTSGLDSAAPAASDGNGSSGMDLSDSDASRRGSGAQPEPEPLLTHTAKRKHSAGADAPDDAQGAAKKQKMTDLDVSQVPVEMWQRIFLFCSPATLSRCLRVCRKFNSALTRSTGGVLSNNVPTPARVLLGGAIWTYIRKTWFPALPRPLPGFTELRMLQLITCKTCQFCNREPVPSQAISPFDSGPGHEGVRVIWPFGIRTCGPCLENNTLTDVQVLKSGANQLRLGLPYVFWTGDRNFVPEVQRQQPGGIPHNLNITKRYYQPDIEKIFEEFASAKSLGEGAADEWQKGLYSRGKEQMSEAARWEKWEAQLPYGSDLSRVLREYDLSSFPLHLEAQIRLAAAGPQPLSIMNGTNTLPQPVHIKTEPSEYHQNGYSSYPQNFQIQHVTRPARRPEEVEAGRAARKADIERRCMQFEPPLEPNVLQHVESFQNAMLMAMPMTDSAWEILKPRILAQREAAELAAHRKAEQWAALQAAMPSARPEEFYAKTAKDANDKEYELAQVPLRNSLGEYANRLIQTDWNGGRDLDKDRAPLFASAILLAVSREYIAEKRYGIIQSNEQTSAEGSSQSTPGAEPFLSLDNMKWIFDNRIRNHTDAHRRELFICAGCATEHGYRPKWFAFEGLIQHYGAKHTAAFSKGNVVVHWQSAEWPGDPPFHTKPQQYVRPDRRYSELRHQDRTRTTPQNGHGGPFAAPGFGKLLSESPFFSGHGQQASTAAYNDHQAYQPYQPYQNGQRSPNGFQYSSPYQTVSPIQPPVDMSYDAQLHKLSSDANEIWESLEGVQERQLLQCVRVQCVLHHVVTRFTQHFRQMPSLDLITSALAASPLMQAIKKANELACKICVAQQTDGSANYHSYWPRIGRIRLFNTSSLIAHFKMMHLSQENAAYPDWTRDMIELPETQLISDLVRAPGMDDEKLAIVAAAFPNAFPSPLPIIGIVQEAPKNGRVTKGISGGQTKMPKQQSKRKKKGQQMSRLGSQDSLPKAKDDEYDPRRPMALPAEDEEFDPARFDTDIARRSSASTSPMHANTIEFAPETLAALSNLNKHFAQSQKSQTDDRFDRAPSVGRAEPALTKPAESAPKAQPDLAAILASLTGQPPPAQTATPPMTVEARSVSAPRHSQPHQELRHSHVRPLSPRYFGEQYHRAESRLAPQMTYRASAQPPAPLEGQDLHAALSRNAQHYEQNRTPTFAEPAYAPSQLRSLPPSRYEYDHSATYYQEQPVQYVTRLPVDQRPATYQPPPQYVDQDGRLMQLIPIDNAPAPVQYAPHPYEQQQYTRR